MIKRYETLTKHLKGFLSASGLQVNEVDRWISAGLPKYLDAEQERLFRSDSERARGGGQSPMLAVRDQILMGVVGLRW